MDGWMDGHEEPDVYWELVLLLCRSHVIHRRHCRRCIRCLIEEKLAKQYLLHIIFHINASHLLFVPQCPCLSGKVQFNSPVLRIV